MPHCSKFFCWKSVFIVFKFVIFNQPVGSKPEGSMIQEASDTSSDKGSSTNALAYPFVMCIKGSAVQRQLAA